MGRLSRKERAAAAQPLSFLPVPGPPLAHPLARADRHNENRKTVFLNNGQTLVQPPLPPLLQHPWFTGAPPNNATNDMPLSEDPRADDYDPSTIIHLERSPPPPDPTQHRRKRAAQWRRWQGEVLPNLVPTFVRILYETKSLRHSDNLKIPEFNPNACECTTAKVCKIALVRFSCMWSVDSFRMFADCLVFIAVEDVEIRICPCSPAAVQLMDIGAFPCAPMLPTLAVDLRVLEFTMNLFVQIAPNTTAFSMTLEHCLSSMGFQLDHQVSGETSALNFINAFS